MDSLTPGIHSSVESLQSSAKAPKFSKDMSPNAVRERAEEFEAFFLSQVLNTMFKGIKTDGPFGGGHGEAVYRELQMQEFGKVIAARGGVGIADSIVRQLLNTQEVSEGAVH